MKVSTIITLFLLIVSLSIFSGCSNTSQGNQEKSHPDTIEVFLTPLGKTIEIPEPNAKLVKQFEEARENYMGDPDNADNIIWYGRRAGYLPDYGQAIEIFTEGIEKFPDDPRMYRHRGHRYISIREFDKAIADLNKAAQLIHGTENEVEPDGMPNVQNIPVSSLHGNIWYHLGLAHYLKHDYVKAYLAYTNCRLSHGNDDNIVSSTHWLYMIQRRLQNDTLANNQLIIIDDNMEIIENFSYYNLCKLYKGIMPLDSVMTGEGSAADAVKYGLANWQLYNGNKEMAKELFEDIIERGGWNSFGYIAAESDLMKYY